MRSSGLLGTVVFNGDSVFPERPYLCLQGTEGLLYLPNPNEFGGEVTLTPGFVSAREIAQGGVPVEAVPMHHGYAEDSRGLGAAEMVDAIGLNRPHRASAELACHILELFDGIVASSTTKQYHQLASSFAVPRRLTGEETF